MKKSLGEEEKISLAFIKGGGKEVKRCGKIRWKKDCKDVGKEGKWKKMMLRRRRKFLEKEEGCKQGKCMGKEECRL